MLISGSFFSVCYFFIPHVLQLIKKNNNNLGQREPHLDPNFKQKAFWQEHRSMRRVGGGDRSPAYFGRCPAAWFCSLGCSGDSPACGRCGTAAATPRGSPACARVPVLAYVECWGRNPSFRCINLDFHLWCVCIC